MSKNGICLISEVDFENPYDFFELAKVSGGAILFRLVVDYMINMFELYQDSIPAYDFKDHIEKVAGVNFVSMKRHSLNILYQKALEMGFKGGVDDLHISTHGE